MDTAECSICYEHINKDKKKKLQCKHKFHRECIKKWFEKERSCPLCRRKENSDSHLHQTNHIMRYAAVLGPNGCYARLIR